MPWIIGIDEAGYGPNLGPFVMSMAAVHVPADLGSVDLWKLLSPSVRRAHQSDDGRIAVDDSKRVYSAAVGLGSLERHVLPFHEHMDRDRISLETLWKGCCLSGLEELQEEPWYSAGCRVGLHNPFDQWLSAREQLKRNCTLRRIAFLPLQSVVLFPRRFNALLADNGSKAAAPAWALRHLLARMPAPRDDRPARIWVDKLGGRNHYHELLQGIFPDGLVMVRSESARESNYQLFRDGGNCELSFQPEADGHFFPVALASMASKYLREVLMEVFNRFWREHVADLKPTAGYPGDAARFYRDIRQARARLGIADGVLWRER